MKSKFPVFFLLAFLASWSFGAFAAPQLAPQTEAQIRAVLNSPKLATAHVGLSILDLGEVQNAAEFPARAPIEKPFQVLFESDAQKKFMPASNMKLFTAAIALHLLGKDKTFPTRVYDDGAALSLRGGGDPSLKAQDIQNLSQQIAVRKIRGSRRVLADGRAFTAETAEGKYPFGWTVDDTLWYYGPEVGALAIERNQADLLITGAEQANKNAHVRLDSPLAAVVEVRANVATIAATQKTGEDKINFNWLRSLDAASARLMVTGEISARQKMRLGIAIADPPLTAAALLSSSLQKSGVAIAFPASASTGGQPVSYAKAQLIAQHHSPTLGVLLQRFLKNSDNLYAEMLLRDAAFYHDNEKNGTAPRAHQLLKAWLIAQSMDVSSLRFEDGSGLSRYNLLTPRATAELLAAINRMPDGLVIWNALPIAGTDGTLRNRMKSTPAANNVRAKTGTFSIASNLSGYVTTRDKKRLAVSLYVNFAPDTATARWAQDAIFTALANGEVANDDVK